MKKFKYLGYCIVAVMLVAICTSGIDKMYVQRLDKSGWVFHVLSQKMNSSSKQKYAPKTINYDYTYVEKLDYVDMLSTLVLPNAATPQSISIVTCNTDTCFNPEFIYVKPKGKGLLEYRLKLSMSFDLWSEMYECEKPFSICYSVKLNGDNTDIKFSYSNSKWKTNRDKMNTIIRVIKFNTGKL